MMNHNCGVSTRPPCGFGGSFTFLRPMPACWPCPAASRGWCELPPLLQTAHTGLHSGPHQFDKVGPRCSGEGRIGGGDRSPRTGGERVPPSIGREETITKSTFANTCNRIFVLSSKKSKLDRAAPGLTAAIRVRLQLPTSPPVGQGTPRVRGRGVQPHRGTGSSWARERAKPERPSRR